jgi:hypothetical protein
MTVLNKDIGGKIPKKSNKNVGLNIGGKFSGKLRNV